jgi:ATP-dependent Clp protease ATP-binding subunit ClpC
MGARPLRRAIVQYVEDPLAEKLLLNPKGEKKYIITTKDDILEFIEENSIIEKEICEPSSTS